LLLKSSLNKEVLVAKTSELFPDCKSQLCMYPDVPMIQLPSCSLFPAGKGHGLTITPYATGHMVGGAMWRIVKEGEEDIIYAVDYNHKKERYYFTEQRERIMIMY